MASVQNERSVVSEHPVYTFARSGNVTELERNLRFLHDINAPNSAGYSALMLAAYRGHVNCVDLLLHAGADANITDPRGNTVLMATAFKGHVPCAQALIKSGAKIQATNHHGLGAHDFACLLGRRDMLSFLADAQNPGSGARFHTGRLFFPIFSAWIKFIFSPMLSVLRRKKSDVNVSASAAGG